MIEYESRMYIERLKKSVIDCRDTSIKVAVNAVGFTIDAFNNDEISEEERDNRIDEINKLTSTFVKNCSCK